MQKGMRIQAIPAVILGNGEMLFSHIKLSKESFPKKFPFRSSKKEVEETFLDSGNFYTKRMKTLAHELRQRWPEANQVDQSAIPKGASEKARAESAYNDLLQSKADTYIIEKKYNKHGRSDIFHSVNEKGSVSTYIYFTPAEGIFFTQKRNLSTLSRLLKRANEQQKEILELSNNPAFKEDLKRQLRQKQKLQKSLHSNASPFAHAFFNRLSIKMRRMFNRLEKPSRSNFFSSSQNFLTEEYDFFITGREHQKDKIAKFSGEKSDQRSSTGARPIEQKESEVAPNERSLESVSVDRASRSDNRLSRTITWKSNQSTQVASSSSSTIENDNEFSRPTSSLYGDQFAKTELPSIPERSEERMKKTRQRSAGAETEAKPRNSVESTRSASSIYNDDIPVPAAVRAAKPQILGPKPPPIPEKSKKRNVKSAQRSTGATFGR